MPRDFASHGGPVRRELAAFYVGSLLFMSAATALLWELPADFRTGDVESARRAMNTVGGVAIFIPVLAAIFVTWAFRGRQALGAFFRRIVILRVSPFYYAIALLAPLVPQWLTVFAWPYLANTAVTAPPLGGLVSYWLQATVFGALILLGEEIGWRGFMLPRLLTLFRWRSSALIGGVLWAVWHFPFWAPANYATTGSVVQTAIILLAGSISAIALSIILTWLFIRTRYSVAIAAVLHGSNNASFKKVYDMIGDSAGANAMWPICYSVAVAAIAAVFFLLPDPPAFVALPAQTKTGNEPGVENATGQGQP
jgi:membrane protease YdiL (CAAX protease family)